MASTVAIALPRLAVTDDERVLIEYHLDRLSNFKIPNKTHEAYYEGSQRVKSLGISLPPSLQNYVETVVGWPGTAVDVLEERLDFLGWVLDAEDDPLGLQAIYEANSLDVDSGLGHLDALIYGTGFVIVGSGYADEPHPLVTVESPFRVTGDFDGRTRRLASALSIDEIDDETSEPQAVTLYLPDRNVTVARSRGVWKVEDSEIRPGRDDHGLGRVLVARLVNRPRASRVEGRSEISLAVRGYTDQAVRTLLGMEVNREFYSAPQRYVLGADEAGFQDKDGNVKTGWETVIGRMLALPRDEDGEIPTVGQFNPASPQPYLDQVRGLAQMLSAEAAIPQNYLGFSSDNPPSADAIRAMEARLVKRAERRQTVFGRAWREVAYLALLVRDGRVPEDFRSVGLKWRDASTPTRAASADEAVKLIGAGVLPPDSPVTYDRIGLTAQEQRQVKSDKRRADSQTRLSALAQAAQAARQNPEVSQMEAMTRGEEE